MVSAPDFGSRGPRFESCWRQNSAHDCMVLHCTEHFIVTLPSSRYDLNDIEGDVKLHRHHHHHHHQHDHHPHRPPPSHHHHYHLNHHHHQHHHHRSQDVPILRVNTLISVVGTKHVCADWSDIYGCTHFIIFMQINKNNNICFLSYYTCSNG